MPPTTLNSEEPVILWMFSAILVVNITTDCTKPPAGTVQVPSGGFRVFSFCA